MAKLKAKGTGFTPADVESLVAQYDAFRRQEAEAKKRKETIADRLKQYADEAGVQDAKGSRYVKTDKFVFGKQARTSVAFVQDVAVDALTARGCADAIDTVRTVNEERFEQLIGEGRVTLDEFISMGAIAQKTTYAIFVKPIDEMTDVEVSALVRR